MSVNDVKIKSKTLGRQVKWRYFGEMYAINLNIEKPWICELHEEVCFQNNKEKTQFIFECKNGPCEERWYFRRCSVLFVFSLKVLWLQKGISRLDNEANVSKMFRNRWRLTRMSGRPFVRNSQKYSPNSQFRGIIFNHAVLLVVIRSVRMVHIFGLATAAAFSS